MTWNTRSSRPGRPSRLRGCIGTFEPQPLREGLAEYALISAFRDTRFRRIEEDELESLPPLERARRRKSMLPSR